MADEEWTPYGLERYRVAKQRTRRFAVLGLVAALLVGYLALADQTTTRETEIFANGQKQGQIGINLDTDLPGASKSRPDATIQVSPGQTARIDTGTQQEAQAAPAVTPPKYEVDPIDWLALLLAIGPFALLATILWLGFRRRAVPEDEVNYGVYKGAMPLEMITASHAHLVLTPKRAKASLFGKSREDYVPDESAT